MAQQTLNPPDIERMPPLIVDTFAGAGDTWKQVVTKQQQMNTELYSAALSTVRKNTALNTVGAGTLLGAALAGGVITRGGGQSGTAFSDTTDTAAAIYAALSSPTSFPISMEVVIKNTTNATETLVAGSGVTLSGQTVIPAASEGRFLLSMSSGTVATLQGLQVTPLSNLPPIASLALTTGGAGTITAAGIVGGLTARGGTQSGTAFTDTTDTAANIIAALPNATIGQSWIWTYKNTTDAIATLAQGSGVTLSGNVIVPNGSWAQYLMTYSAAGAVTMSNIGQGRHVDLPTAKFTTAALSAAAFTAGAITGAKFTVLQNTGATPGNQTVRTAAQMLADIGAQAGDSFMFRIVNTGAGTLTIVADAGPTVTLTGTMTVAQNVYRDYVLTFNSATTATIQSVGSGTSP